MNKSKWLVLAVALGMMAATGGYLVKIHHRIRLGEAGVKFGPGKLYDEEGHLAAEQCVLLPERVSGIEGRDMAVTEPELEQLPRDTTFGRKLYANDKFNVANSVVLMGTDRTSIHQPQYCLDAQGWHIDKTEQIMLPMDRPYPYEVPALKLTTTSKRKLRSGAVVELRGIYIYWFVSGDRVTANQGTRLWSLAKSIVEKGVLERWAYISYLSVCYPGQEDATSKRLEEFIRKSVPEFQTVAGQAETRAPVASR